MRRRIAASAAALALAVLLLVNFRTPEDLALQAATGATVGTDTASGGTDTASGARSGSGGSTRTATGGIGSTGSSSSNGSSSVVGSSRSAPTPSTGPVLFAGPVAADPFGNVQVQITVSGGKIVDVVALALPVGGHSGRISNYVAPILRTQALTAQSAAIDGVSGATYTSRAYAASLQGALDQAGL